jgi:hypothetical protein
MQEPFPEELEAPYGLVTIRTICNLPVWMLATLAGLGVAPLYVWGFSKWWVGALCVGLGMLLAVEAVDDPRFLTAWIGEWGLKDYYD